MPESGASPSVPLIPIVELENFAGACTVITAAASPNVSMMPQFNPQYPADVESQRKWHEHSVVNRAVGSAASQESHAYR